MKWYNLNELRLNGIIAKNWRVRRNSYVVSSSLIETCQERSKQLCYNYYRSHSRTSRFTNCEILLHRSTVLKPLKNEQLFRQNRMHCHLRKIIMLHTSPIKAKIKIGKIAFSIGTQPDPNTIWVAQKTNLRSVHVIIMSFCDVTCAYD
jgi:hypothetical protein